MALDLTPQLRRMPPAWRGAARKNGARRTGPALESSARRRLLSTLLIGLAPIGAVLEIVYPGPLVGAPIVPIVVAAGLFLGGVGMYAVFASAGLCLLISSIYTDTPPTTVAAVAIVMLLLIAVERRRNRIGISGEESTAMLVDLRERLAEHGRLSDLPAGWHIDSSIQAARGEAISGDFVVAHQGKGDTVELVLVDVEGCGVQTGTRSLMLAGAFSGLVGATSPASFLPAANRYLTRQGFEGCATAIHVALDLTTGAYSIGSAGHPAAMHFHAGAGRWDARTEASGVMLGVVDSELVDYRRAVGYLERGDALLLYSDGVVESPNCDLRQGMDRMLGVADRVVTTVPHDGDAAQICEVAQGGKDDDRTAVLIRRD